MTEVAHDLVRGARTVWWMSGGVLLVVLAFATESFVGVGHHLLLVAGGIAFGIGVGRKPR